MTAKVVLAFGAIVFGCVISTGVAAQTPQTEPLLPKKEIKSGKRGPVVTLKVPMTLLQSRGGSLETTITGAPGALRVSGQDDWQSCCFPSMLKLEIRSVSKPEKWRPVTQVLTYTDGGIVYLNFDPSIADVESALRELVLVDAPNSEAAKAYLKQRYEDMASNVFTGSLASVPEEARMVALRYADGVAHAARVGIATYKDQPYFLLDLGEGDSVYNTLQMNETARVARTINDTVLKVLKGSMAAFSQLGQTTGVKVQMKVLSRNFARSEFATPEVDLLTIYAPFDLIKKFADADITSQQLIDGSVVLVNDNRVQVPLAGGGK